MDRGDFDETELPLESIAVTIDGTELSSESIPVTIDKSELVFEVSDLGIKYFRSPVNSGV